MSATASVLLNRLLGRGRLKHLQVLVKVAELGSFKKTGEAVGMTQPAITHVVADLEALLGIELFVRHARGVTPSPFCEELVPMARQVLQSVGLGMEAVIARMELHGANVRIGATTAGVAGLLADSLPAFMDRHPEISVHVTDRQTDELVALAQRSEVDLLVYRRPDILPGDWTFVPLVSDHLVVVCGPDHPLLKRKRVKFTQLANETWLAAPVSTLGRRLLDALLLEKGMTPRYAHISTIALPLTLALLSRKRLLTLIPMSVLKPFIAAGQVAVLAVDESFPLGPLGMLARSDGSSPASQSLADFLRSFHAGDPAGEIVTGL